MQDKLEEAIRQKAMDLQSRLGGIIFVFPVEEDDPHSEYASAIYTGDDRWSILPDTGRIEDMCAGLVAAMQEFEAGGVHIDFERDVRIVSYQAQMNAPDVIMRRLRNNPDYYTTVR